MTETIIRWLLRLSESGDGEILTGFDARPLYGREFERLLRRGVLSEVAEVSEWATCFDCECDAHWRTVASEGAHYRARCPLDHARDAVLQREDLRAFRLCHESFAQFLADAAGVGAEAEPIVPGAWILGRLPSRRQIAVCFERRVVEMPGLPTMLKDLTDPHLSLLSPMPKPKTRIELRAAGIDPVELASVCMTDPAGRLSLDTTLIEPTGSARLVLNLSTRRVFVDGTPQHVPGQPFRLLEMLVTAAVAGAGAVPRFDVEERMSGRKAADLARDLRKALSKGRSNPDEMGEWIAADRSASAFRITLSPAEIDLRN